MSKVYKRTSFTSDDLFASVSFGGGDGGSSWARRQAAVVAAQNAAAARAAAKRKAANAAAAAAGRRARQDAETKNKNQAAVAKAKADAQRVSANHAKNTLTGQSKNLASTKTARKAVSSALTVFSIAEKAQDGTLVKDIDNILLANSPLRGFAPIYENTPIEAAVENGAKSMLNILIERLIKPPLAGKALT